MAKADIYGCLTQFLADCKRYKTRKGKAGGRGCRYRSPYKTFTPSKWRGFSLLGITFHPGGRSTSLIHIHPLAADGHAPASGSTPPLYTDPTIPAHDTGGDNPSTVVPGFVRACPGDGALASALIKSETGSAPTTGSCNGFPITTDRHAPALNF